MIKKNPKKNYSLKGKPLSTKIVFVVICVFIFSLFVGSFGGLLYIGSSCSGFTTVSAEGLGGTGSSTVTTVETYATLNLSSLHYEIYEPTDAEGNPIEPYMEFMFFLPLTVRSVTSGSNSSVYLDYQYWQYSDNSVAGGSIDLGLIPAGESVNFNYGGMEIHYTELYNIGFRVAASTVLVEDFSTLSYIEFGFRGNDLTSRQLGLVLYDINGHSREYNIAPLYALGSRGYFLNSNTGYSATFKYSLAPFNYDAVSNAYANGYDDALRDVEFLFEEFYDDGYDDGLARGQILGAAEAGDYSFASLLDAVFYAPVKMFVSLFNFDFLGINVLALATTLITVVIAFGILKFFI